MSKGHVMPQTKAPWSGDAAPIGRGVLPVWLKIVAVEAVVVVDFEGVPVPTTIDASHLSPARWAYNQQYGLTYWEGDWATLFGSGRWQVTCNNGNWPWCNLTFRFRVDTLLGFEYCFWDAHLSSFDGRFPSQDVFAVGCPYLVSYDLLWTPVSSPTMRGMRYAEIRAIGEDSNDCQPRTWAGTPW